MTRKHNDDLGVLLHDLRPPLRDISCYTDLLCRIPIHAANENARMFRDRIVSGVNQMDALITRQQSLLGGAGRRRRQETADLTLCLDRAIETLQQQISETEAEIVSAGLHLAHGNENDVTRVFVNLLSNALKYCRPGIRPLIRIDSEDMGQEWVIVTVGDNGMGFESKLAPLIFAPGVRLNTAIPGEGLGLASVRSMIDRSGGHVTAFSEGIGHGASFCFCLRRASAASQPALPKRKGAASEVRTAPARSQSAKAKAAGGEI